ncbi:MAG TPA: PEP/pyruvate-binding domain-containing protein, partial [Flavisolibacter sp.]|nr:PEP/pyruvate-binding domain-containing protein [Flavisolibacter sp.]
MQTFIKRFKDIGIADVPSVGGKNSSLGEMFNHLASKGVAVPDGFATTAFAFWTYLDFNKLQQRLVQLLSGLDKPNFSNLKIIGAQARALILEGTMPDALAKEIVQAYHQLGSNLAVAVRSSATAEDLPEASFAGQHESYLNIRGDKDLLEAVKKCFASLYT